MCRKKLIRVMQVKLSKGFLLYVAVIIKLDHAH